MAEGGGNWWDSWYNAAKSKSAEVLEFVKRDLDEFSTAVKSEASNVVTSTTSALKDKLKLDEPESTANTVKRSFSSFLGQMSNVLNPSPQDDDEEAIVIFDAEPVPLTKFQAKLHSIILDPNTFLTDPDEKYTQQYEAWLEIIEDQLTTERLSKLMAASPDLHQQYTKLVPEQVSHILFWQRYLFRKALLEDEEARREALERRAERERKAAEQFQWEKEQDFGPNIELSEEEQIRILQEYEKECEEKRLKQDQETLLDSSFKFNHYSDINGSLVLASSSLKGADVDIVETTDDIKRGYCDKDSDDIDSLEKDCIGMLQTREKKDMVVVGYSPSAHTSSCSGDKESNDDDWEREFDIEESDLETTTEQKGVESVSGR
ncbi:BSD domain-containing protein 1-like [Schistocerca cancellata]|uniref:BSD domain-containing protein 1-like n=1 Tax=Schistocerca cancellata TaxID=274614 RepID=UPI0021189DCF|nr:BSD domain-containing protein 1-like [Schistocerca cancellata]